MIATDPLGEGTASRLVIQPNRSMGWNGIVIVYGVVVLVAGLVAVGMALVGAWPVLPFAGLELAALGAALYTTAWRGEHREVVSIRDEWVTVEKGYRGPQERHEFQRAWVQVVMQPRRGWYPARLYLRSHGRRVELGTYINEEERQRLAQELARALRDPEPPERAAQETGF